MGTCATPVSARELHAAIDEVCVTHVVTVPDTHQRTLLERLDRDPSRPLVRAATEDDVFASAPGCGSQVSGRWR